MEFKAGDLVQIWKQPSNQTTHLVGKVCIIDEVANGVAILTAIRLNGESDGGGGCSIEYLQPETRTPWLAARKIFDAHVEALLAISRAEAEARGLRWQARIAAVAEKYQVTPEVANAIYKELSKYED